MKKDNIVPNVLLLFDKETNALVGEGVHFKGHEYFEEFKASMMSLVKQWDNRFTIISIEKRKGTVCFPNIDTAHIEYTFENKDLQSVEDSLEILEGMVFIKQFAFSSPSVTSRRDVVGFYNIYSTKKIITSMNNDTITIENKFELKVDTENNVVNVIRMSTGNEIGKFFYKSNSPQVVYRPTVYSVEFDVFEHGKDMIYDAKRLLDKLRKKPLLRFAEAFTGNIDSKWNDFNIRIDYDLHLISVRNSAIEYTVAKFECDGNWQKVIKVYCHKDPNMIEEVQEALEFGKLLLNNQTK